MRHGLASLGSAFGCVLGMSLHPVVSAQGKAQLILATSEYAQASLGMGVREDNSLATLGRPYLPTSIIEKKIQSASFQSSFTSSTQEEALSKAFGISAEAQARTLNYSVSASFTQNREFASQTRNLTIQLFICTAESVISFDNTQTLPVFTDAAKAKFDGSQAGFVNDYGSRYVSALHYGRSLWLSLTLDQVSVQNNQQTGVKVEGSAKGLGWDAQLTAEMKSAISESLGKQKMVISGRGLGGSEKAISDLVTVCNNGTITDFKALYAAISSAWNTFKSGTEPILMAVLVEPYPGLNQDKLHISENEVLSTSNAYWDAVWKYNDILRLQKEGRAPDSQKVARYYVNRKKNLIKLHRDLLDGDSGSPSVEEDKYRNQFLALLCKNGIILDEVISHTPCLSGPNCKVVAATLRTQPCFEGKPYTIELTGNIVLNMPLPHLQIDGVIVDVEFLVDNTPVRFLTPCCGQNNSEYKLGWDAVAGQFVLPVSAVGVVDGRTLAIDPNGWLRLEVIIKTARFSDVNVQAGNTTPPVTTNFTVPKGLRIQVTERVIPPVKPKRRG